MDAFGCADDKTMPLITLMMKDRFIGKDTAK